MSKTYDFSDTLERKTTFIKEVECTDPDTGAEITLEIHKDPVSGGLFAVEAEYLDQVTDKVISPYSVRYPVPIIYTLDMSDETPVESPDGPWDKDFREAAEN